MKLNGALDCSVRQMQSAKYSNSVYAVYGLALKDPVQLHLILIEGNVNTEVDP